MLSRSAPPETRRAPRVRIPYGTLQHQWYVATYHKESTHMGIDNIYVCLAMQDTTLSIAAVNPDKAAALQAGQESMPGQEYHVIGLADPPHRTKDSIRLWLGDLGHTALEAEYLIKLMAQALYDMINGGSHHPLDKHSGIVKTDDAVKGGANYSYKRQS